MKTLCVVSDSHGNREAIDKLFSIFGECDYIIHLGDTSSDGFYIKKAFPEKTYLLNGNCDFTRIGQDELTLDIEGVKIFACHGDRYGVKAGYDRIAYAAKERNCRVALFGHTHEAVELEIAGISLFNPGSLSRYGRRGYLYLVISDGKICGKLVDMD